MYRNFRWNLLVQGMVIATVGFVSGHWISGSFFSGQRVDSPALKMTKASSMVEMQKTGRVENIKKSPSKILKRISEIDRISDFGLRITTANRLLRKLSADDCKALLSELGENMSYELIGRIVARLMEEDPNGAMALDPEGFKGYIKYLARKSPDATIEWLKRRGAEIDIDQTKRFREAFLKEVALRDPMKAKNLEKTLAPADSHIDFGVFVAARGVDYTLNWLKNFNPGELNGPYATSLYKIAQYEPVQLLSKLESPEYKNLLKENTSNIAAGIAVADHQLANDYLKSIGEVDSLMAESIVDHLTYRGDNESDEAVRWVLLLPETSEYDHAKIRFVSNACNDLHDPIKSLDVYLTLSSPRKADDLYQVFDLWHYEKPEEAKLWFKAHMSMMPKRTSPPRREFDEF